MHTNSDESKALSTLISNLSINESGYIRKDKLKSFVQNDLELTGKWSSPGGETKLLKTLRSLLNGLVKRERRL
jgi:hypothetical protein